MLSETGVVCMITCTDDTTHSVYSCIKGKLVEVNDRLIENVSLLTSKVSLKPVYNNCEMSQLYYTVGKNLYLKTPSHQLLIVAFH